jgi:thiamine-phosphate pyrophosphorylase
MNTPPFKLMLLTQKNDTPNAIYLDFIKRCIEGGITAVQIREKNLTDNELLDFAQELQAMLLTAPLPLIINDNVDLAIAVNTAGVHLGQTDGCPIQARQRFGLDKIIGVSIDSIENLYTANQHPIDYVGIGAIFPTQNKSNVQTIWGLKRLRTLAGSSKHPIIAIGGINETNVHEVMLAGAHGIAVIGAAHHATYPTHSLRHIRKIIDQQGNSS